MAVMDSAVDDVLASIDADRAAGEHRRASHLVQLYLDLLEQTLTGIILNDAGYAPSIDLSAGISVDNAARRMGLDWPLHAQTMIGLPRLRNLRRCVTSVLKDRVPGDFIETGVWRGGACIFMRAILAAYGVRDRRVWVADSFEGLPPPDPDTYPADAGDALHQVKFLAVSLEEVKANFNKYEMLDENVVFLKGFFKDTLATAPIQKLSVVRLDGDMYSSTIEALEALYPKLSVRGYLIVDDYSLPNCAKAVHDYRTAHGITCPIETIDDSAVFWRRTR